jgi:hypothetical protein
LPEQPTHSRIESGRHGGNTSQGFGFGHPILPWWRPFCYCQCASYSSAQVLLLNKVLADNPQLDYTTVNFYKQLEMF